MDTKVETRFEIVKLEERIAPLLCLGDIGVSGSASVNASASASASALNAIHLGGSANASLSASASVGL